MAKNDTHINKAESLCHTANYVMTSCPSSRRNFPQSCDLSLNYCEDEDKFHMTSNCRTSNLLCKKLTAMSSPCTY